MPEGHTIHRLARDHTRDLARRPLEVSSPQGRATEAAALLDGAEVRRIDAHGKHLLYRWSTGDTLHVHLGLYGRFIRQASPAAAPRGAKRLRLAGPEWTVDLSGPTACELLDEAQEDALLARLGPDPLRADGDPDEFAARLRRRRIPIGAALLDQRVIAGLGNVYRAEVLSILRLDPRRPANTLAPAEAQAVWEESARLLKAGVQANRIVTVPRRSGRKGRVPRSEATFVYRQAACLRCGGPVETYELAARTMWSCPACQPAIR
jgi:endonuclease-8